MIAITRAVSPRIDECIVTHIERAPINAARAAAQHRAYEQVLATLGCTIVAAPPAPELPDAVFVEDAAVVLDEVALLARPAAPSRRAEPASLEPLLARWRDTRHISKPATLDGGDVLITGRAVFVGASARTNAAGIMQLRSCIEPFGYTLHAVPVTGCLHLKSAVTTVDDDTVLINPDWTDAAAFAAYRQIRVDPAEPFAANALRVGQAVIHAATHVRTRERLERHGIRVHAVDASELAKAEAGVTCCAILLRP
ncbi:MAG TPA: arginine deiminase family protein [Longimicrobiales bacterium]|nr:arginine deiminase family protein [Longimicrobiales bacterium]